MSPFLLGAFTGWVLGAIMHFTLGNPPGWDAVILIGIISGFLIFLLERRKL